MADGQQVAPGVVPAKDIKAIPPEPDYIGLDKTQTRNKMHYWKKKYGLVNKQRNRGPLYAFME